MNFVVVKYFGDSGKHLFEIPDGVDVDCGTIVSAESYDSAKEKVGMCATSSFTADPEAIFPLWGVRDVKRVRKVYRDFCMVYSDEVLGDEEIPFSSFSCFANDETKRLINEVNILSSSDWKSSLIEHKHPSEE